MSHKCVITPRPPSASWESASTRQQLRVGGRKREGGGCFLVCFGGFNSFLFATGILQLFLVVTMFQVMIHWLEGRSGKKGTQHQGPCVTRDDITSSHGSRKGGMCTDMITRPFIFSSYQLRSSDSTILLILNL